MLGRAPLRIFHQGCVEADNLPTSLLFPTEQDLKRHLPPRPWRGRAAIQNQSVAGNAAQSAAVQHVVEGVVRSVPYVIFGPPGTGECACSRGCSVVLLACGSFLPPRAR